MITEPTVLVLGAGASYPYGYPLGAKLYYQVVSSLCPFGINNMRQFLDPIYGSAQVHEFGEALRRSGIEAVDAFLEHNEQFLDIGRSAIAYAIARREDENTLFPDAPNEKHWYRFLFNCLGLTCTPQSGPF